MAGLAMKDPPKVYSIAAHRGFADALIAGLVPRYADPELGLARLTLLLPSGRAVRTVTEAFIRHSGSGLLMPRMAVVGDLDLDETLGPLLDPLGAADIAPSADPTRRWLRMAELIRENWRKGNPPKGSALLRLAFEFGGDPGREAVSRVCVRSTRVWFRIRGSGRGWREGRSCMWGICRRGWGGR